MPSPESLAALSTRFEKLLGQHGTRRPAADRKRLERAFTLAQEMYGEREHWSGVSVLEHALGVLQQYLVFEPDDDGIIACLFHHMLDTKLWTLDDIGKEWGASVRSIVSGVHLLSHVTMKNRRMSLENLRLMFLRVSDDVRVVLLILCDTSFKLSHLNTMSPERRRHVCHDVLSLFAPVAARLGIYSLKHQLEAGAFPVAEQVRTLHAQHGAFLSAAERKLSAALREAGIAARVEGREKQPFSIFQKMRQKSLTHVGDVYDLFALRVIVEDEASCYQALGVLHRIGHPIAHRFKDYIAFPKPNGYQSLHTTLARLPGTPEGVFMEVQIRTPVMHREAELGIAAHWSYKEGGTAAHAMRRAQLQKALTFQQPLERDEEEAFTDHIFALTPNGDIIELPEGATVLDFAFHVHTALGLSFRAARVNGSIVPLSYEMENGDIVEILRHRDPHPTFHWVNHLKTASARSRLKRYLAVNERPVFVQMGRDALNEELKRLRLPLLDPDLQVLRSFGGKRLPFAEREDLLVKVGQGAQTASSLLLHLDALKDSDAVQERRHAAKRKRPTAPHPFAPQAGIRMEGDIPMPVRFARCCKADDHYHGPITGVIGRDGIVRVHREGCKMLRNANPERIIGVRWEEGE